MLKSHVYAKFSTNHPYSDLSLERSFEADYRKWNVRKEIAHCDKQARLRRDLNSRGKLLRSTSEAPSQNWG